MFVFSFVDFSSPPDPITHLAVCNNYLVMAMSSNILLRIDLEHPDTPEGKIVNLSEYFAMETFTFVKAPLTQCQLGISYDYIIEVLAHMFLLFQTIAM